MSERLKSTERQVQGNPEFLDTQTGEKGIFKILNSELIIGDPNQPVRLSYAWVRTDDGGKYRDRLRALDTAKRFLTQLVKLHGKNFYFARVTLAGMVEGRDSGEVFELFELYGIAKQAAGGSDKKLNKYLLENGVRQVDRGPSVKKGEAVEALPVWVRNTLAHPEDRGGEQPEDARFLNSLIEEAVVILREFTRTQSTQSGSGVREEEQSGASNSGTS